MVLHCDNPDCGRLILEEPIAYDKRNGEVYHSGRCALFANAYKALNAEEVVFSSLDYITLEEALELLRKGELSQASSLEERVK